MVLTKFTIEQSALFELAMSYGNSEDLKTNAYAFLEKISELFNLNFAGYFQKEDIASNNSTAIHVFPKKYKCGLIQGKSLLKQIQKEKIIVADETEYLGKKLLKIIYQEKGKVLVFDTPFLFLYLFREKENFREADGLFLKDQVHRFSSFIKVLYDKNRCEEKLVAYETKEENFKLSEQEHQAIKNELVQTQSRFSIMYKNMNDGIFIYNYLAEKIIDFNDSAFKAFGYSTREELLNKTRFEFVPQFSKYFPNNDLHEYTRGHGIKVCNGESVEKTLGVFINSDNEEFYVEANVVPTHQQKGEAFIIFRDTTERLKARQILKSREKKYRQIFENSHEAIIYFDIKNQKIKDCNDKALRLFEIENKERFFETNFGSFYDSQATGINAFDFFEKQVNIAVEKGIANFQFLAKTIKNNNFWADGNVIVEMGSKGPRKLTFFIRDITENYNQRKALQNQHKKLKKYIESNLQLENFAYVASHDLQTPLHTIINFTELLSKSTKGKINEEEKEYLNFIDKATKNMRGLIHDLLSFSLVNNTKNKIEAINIPQLLLDIKDELQFEITKKKATIIFPEKPFLIKADTFKLKQIFQNLLTNALKFIKPNVAPIVKISFKEEQDFWLFSIADNGIGIETQYQEKIFLLFKRLHVKEKYKGTGIGLATCKKIVEQHQGEIWLSSEIGKGTTFYFSIKKNVV